MRFLVNKLKGVLVFLSIFATLISCDLNVKEDIPPNMNYIGTWKRTHHGISDYTEYKTYDDMPLIPREVYYTFTEDSYTMEVREFATIEEPNALIYKEEGSLELCGDETFHAFRLTATSRTGNNNATAEINMNAGQRYGYTTYGDGYELVLFLYYSIGDYGPSYHYKPVSK